jgi:U-box domain
MMMEIGVQTNNDVNMDAIPSEFICPISLSIMKHPVMSMDGKNFERNAILDWLNRGNTVCPLTRKPLKPSYLAPNVSLKIKIEMWKKESGMYLSNDEDDGSSSSDESDEVGIVGVLQYEQEDEETLRLFEAEAAREEEIESRRWQETQRIVDEELSDLLELFNEVLGLTSSSASTFPPRRPSPFEDAKASSKVAQVAARRWKPSSLQKEKATSS